MDYCWLCVKFGSDTPWSTLDLLSFEDEKAEEKR